LLPLRSFGEATRLTAGLVHIIDDDPDAVNTLIEVAGTRRFDHRIQQLRHAAKANAPTRQPSRSTPSAATR
jgi:hypothetical protein